jgi:hypothetical protein
MLIFRANSAADKRPFLDQMIERATCAGMLLRLSMDMRLISEKEYAAAIELTNNVGKQANGWRKSQR